MSDTPDRAPVVGPAMRMIGDQRARDLRALVHHLEDEARALRRKLDTHPRPSEEEWQRINNAAAFFDRSAIYVRELES